MKSFLVLVAFFAAATASAQNMTELKDGDLSLSQAEAQISSIKPMCPKLPGRPTCMAIGSVVTLKVTMNGCLDRLGGTFSKFEVIDGRGVLYFGAINAQNEMSLRARCVAAPVEYTKVTVPFEGPIDLVELDFAASRK